MRFTREGAGTMQNARDVIIRYLEDAIAAERAFETQLRGFAKEGDEPEAREMFLKHAEETRRQHELLANRLNSLGGTASGAKSFLATMFGLAPKTAQIGYDESERVTQNLIMAYSVENAEVAMYETLALAARSGGDAETEQLARTIQRQEQETSDKIQALLPAVAERSYREAVEGMPGIQTAGARE